MDVSAGQLLCIVALNVAYQRHYFASVNGMDNID